MTSVLPASQKWVPLTDCSARYDAPAEGIITALNTTWVVPSLPATSRGSNAPGWWFGVMDKDGTAE